MVGIIINRINRYSFLIKIYIYLKMKALFPISSVILFTSILFTSVVFGQNRKIPTQIKFMGNRFLTLNTVIRVYQVEATGSKHFGAGETELYTPDRVKEFREAIAAAFPHTQITWAFSWL